MYYSELFIFSVLAGWLDMSCPRHVKVDLRQTLHCQ